MFGLNLTEEREKNQIKYVRLMASGHVWLVWFFFGCKLISKMKIHLTKMKPKLSWKCRVNSSVRNWRIFVYLVFSSLCPNKYIFYHRFNLCMADVQKLILNQHRCSIHTNNYMTIFQMLNNRSWRPKFYFMQWNANGLCLI